MQFLKPDAIKCFDGEHTRGYVMFLTKGWKKIDGSTGMKTTQRKTAIRILNSKDGYTYSVTDTGREIEVLKDFPWDDTL